MRAVDVLGTLELLGSGQWGLVTTAQASEAGVSKMHLSRLADRGTVQRVRHGVYALPSANTGPLQGLRAAWLATGGQAAGKESLAVVSGESAAAVHGLGDLLPSNYEFTATVRRQSTQPDVRYRKRALPVEDVVWVNGLPVTTIARTVEDLATGGTDFDHLAVAVRDAVTTTGVASGALAQALEPAASRFGSPDGNALLSTALKAVGYRPDPQLVDPEIREELLRTLVPELETIVSEVVADQLGRVFAQPSPSRVPARRRRAPQKNRSRDAARRPNRKAVDGETTHPAGSESPQKVSRRKAG